MSYIWNEFKYKEDQSYGFEQKNRQNLRIIVQGEQLEQVKEYTYLGSVIDGTLNSSVELKKCIGMAKSAFWNCKDILRENIPLQLRKRLLNCYVKSVLTYSCEAWMYSKGMQNKINALQMWCYRRMLKIGYIEHVTNNTVKACIGENKGCWAEDVIRRKLTFAGHIMRGSGGRIAQLVLEGMVDGKKDRGRQRRVWGDNVKEWAVCESYFEAKI